MDVQENCIQLKIDTIISDINQNSQDNQNEEKNQITALMGYSHCLDLFDFLQIYSKVQKNEILFQTAIIYDSIGYTELSMDYINKSLEIIPNVPSIILYKSGLFASLNKLDEAQKWLLKYKYLIGENPYDNYIHDTFLVLLYYLLEYEEYIILRKINSIEDKYSEYIKGNNVLFFIKSNILEKLAQKIKNTDKKRYISYIKESNIIKNEYINNKKNEIEILFEQGIRSENATKSLVLINPNFLNYKPKKLIEYKNGFNKNGFSLFYTLIKICKILKLGIEAKKYIKIINQKKINKNDNDNDLKNINDVLKNFEEIPSNLNSNNSTDLTIDNNLRTCEESIKRLYKSIWLKGFRNNKNIIKKINFQNSKIKTNFYINEGYYSHLNLKESILKNIEFNNNYKNNHLDLDSSFDDLKEEEKKLIIDKNNKNKEMETKENIETNNNNNNDENKIHIKKVDINTNSNKIKTNRIKNSLSYIIKKVITGHQKENHRNKRNKVIMIDNKESKKSKKFCSTDNCKNQQIKINKKKCELIKIESNSKINKKGEEIINGKQKKNGNLKKEKSNSNGKYNNNNDMIDKKENQIKEKNQNEIIIIENRNNSNKILKNNNNKNNLGKNNKDDDIKNINTKNNLVKNNKDNNIKNINNKNNLLTANESNKKIGLINTIEQVKTLNKNNNNNKAIGIKEEKKIDTDYRKNKDIRELNLISYCLKQLTKKKEKKIKNIKQKEIANLTYKIDMMIPQKVIDYEKKILQINENNKNIKSKSKKKKDINKLIKKQINTFTCEKKMRKTNQKNSDNNLINSNKSLYNNGINSNSNMKNLKQSINNYGNKKELSKFKSLNYLHGNIYSNNNYLNINFNNYMNYYFNYSNRHEDRKNFDFRFNPNSDNKKREESNSKEKFKYRTINLDFKNMSTKLNNPIKKPLLHSFIDSKENNQKSSDNKYDFVNIPLNKIKNSPSGEVNCLKRKLKTFKSNLIKQKTKTSFSKYMLYNIGKKPDVFYFNKSINVSEYNKYKNFSVNKSKNAKNKYNKTITNKSNSKIISK